MTYIYALCEPTGAHEVRYVGKANDPYRRLKQHIYHAKRRTSGNPRKDAWFLKTQKEGYTPIVETLEMCEDADWEEAERAWISFYRECIGPKLLNLTDGGDAPKPKIVDHTNSKYHQVTIHSCVGFTRNSKALWQCTCDCGNTFTTIASDVVSGQVKSCGCLKKRGNRTIDIKGLRFGSLVALRREGRNSVGKPVWLLQCDCGRTKLDTASRLRAGTIVRCGHGCPFPPPSGRQHG